MSGFEIPQLVGAVIGAVTAVVIAGIIKMLNRANDADF